MKPITDVIGYSDAWLIWRGPRPNDVIRNREGVTLQFESEHEALHFIEHYDPPDNTFPHTPICSFEAMGIEQIPGAVRGTLGDTVFVAGAGPSLATTPYPTCDASISCNSAAWNGMPWTINVFYDHRIVYHPNWGAPCPGKIAMGTRCLNRMLMIPANARYEKVDYYYNYMPPISETMPDAWVLDPTLLRGGFNVFGMALQLAYWGGAKTIICAGCEQRGPHHWDGFENPDPHKFHQGVWRNVARIDRVIHLIQRAGTRVITLCETALQNPERGF